VCALHSSMSPLDISTDHMFDCADDDSGGVAFVRATSLIGGQNAVKEYLACGLFLLLVSFSLGEIADGEVRVSKITVPLPEFPLTKFQGESNDHFFSEGGARCRKCHWQLRSCRA
jgi:hypothetical protein